MKSGNRPSNGKMIFRKAHRSIPRINIVALIDVVFLLLLFFMLTTTFKFTTEGINVDLPNISSKGEAALLESVVIIDRDGGIFYDGRPVSLNDLETRLAADKDLLAEGMVVIKADEKVRHGRVVEVMDRVNLVGVKRIAIATEPLGGS